MDKSRIAKAMLVDQSVADAILSAGMESSGATAALEFSLDLLRPTSGAAGEAATEGGADAQWVNEAAKAGQLPAKWRQRGAWISKGGEQV